MPRKVVSYVETAAVVGELRGYPDRVAFHFYLHFVSASILDGVVKGLLSDAVDVLSCFQRGFRLLAEGGCDLDPVP